LSEDHEADEQQSYWQLQIPQVTYKSLERKHWWLWH